MGFRPLIAFGLAFGCLATLSPGASAETREQYLARLETICEVECLQPRQFQRTARKRKASDESEMAIIMDVAEVRMTGDKISLYDKAVETSNFEVLDALGSAGLDASLGRGIGGVARTRQEGTHPNVVVIELDQQTALDLLGPLQAEEFVSSTPNGKQGDILVEGDRERKVRKPTLSDIRNLLRNRRVVVRGTPRLEVRIVGARRDFHRKQVILEVGSANDLVLLPRYGKDGEPIYGGEFDVVDAPAP